MDLADVIRQIDEAEAPRHVPHERRQDKRQNERGKREEEKRVHGYLRASDTTAVVNVLAFLRSEAGLILSAIALDQCRRKWKPAFNTDFQSTYAFAAYACRRRRILVAAIMRQDDRSFVDLPEPVDGGQFSGAC